MAFKQIVKKEKILSIPKCPDFKRGPYVENYLSFANIIRDSLGKPQRTGRNCEKEFDCSRFREVKCAMWLLEWEE